MRMTLERSVKEISSKVGLRSDPASPSDPKGLALKDSLKGTPADKLRVLRVAQGNAEQDSGSVTQQN